MSETEMPATTGEIREDYATRMTPADGDARRRRFDRWLARVKAKAIRDAAQMLDVAPPYPATVLHMGGDEA